MKKEPVNQQTKVPNRSTNNRIAMLPKQRYKQEQRLMLLNADSIVDTYHVRKSAKLKTNNLKQKTSSQSTEEGFDEDFTSFSDEDDELLILQQTSQVDDVDYLVKPFSTTGTQKTQVFKFNGFSFLSI